MVSPTLLSQLRCLHTSSPLRPVDVEICAQLNQMIEERKIFDLLGRCLMRRLDGMLVNADFSYGYSIQDEVPQLLRDEAIVLENKISGQIRNKMTGDFNHSE